MSGHTDNAHGAGGDQPGISGDEALARLLDGNERFLRGETRSSGPAEFTGMRREALADLAKGQKPFATILGCSDSRVPPEMIFDAVLGELFVIRVAGNVLTQGVTGSLQYAGAHLETPLFVVLGHEGCGAVSAALDSRFQGVQHRSRIQTVVDTILPALADVDPRLPSLQQLQRAVEANVRWCLRTIRESPEVEARAREGSRMTLVGAVYEIESGRVRILDEQLG